MKQNEIDLIEIFGTVASVAAVIIIFYVIKHPNKNNSNSNNQEITPPSISIPDLNEGLTSNTPNYDDEDTGSNGAGITYNIAGDDISSDFCSSCNS